MLRLFIIRLQSGCFLAHSGFRTRTISVQRNTEAHGRARRLDLCEPAALWSVALLQKHRIQKWFFTFVSPELTTHCAQRIPQDEAVFIKTLSATSTFCLWQWTASNTRRASLFPKESLVLLAQIWTLKMKRGKNSFQISEMSLSRRCVISVDVWRSREKALFCRSWCHTCVWTGPRVWCLSAGSHQCIQNKFAVDIRDKLNSLVLALFVCECQNLSAVIGADSDHLSFRCVNEWEQLAANQGVTTRRRPLTKAEECCESLWSF